MVPLPKRSQQSVTHRYVIYPDMRTMSVTVNSFEVGSFKYFLDNGLYNKSYDGLLCRSHNYCLKTMSTR